MVVNRVDTARHGLILCQHGATAYTELLESNFDQYRAICDRMLLEIIDFPPGLGDETPIKQIVILLVGWRLGQSVLACFQAFACHASPEPACTIPRAEPHFKQIFKATLRASQALHSAFLS